MFYLAIAFLAVCAVIVVKGFMTKHTKNTTSGGSSSPSDGPNTKI